MKNLMILREDFRENFSSKVEEVSNWLEEFAGKRYKDPYYRFDYGFLEFEENDYDYVASVDAAGLLCIFKDDNKAMLFKLTWC
jgi:hypothetical protein